jgi:hypothetical protein
MLTSNDRAMRSFAIATCLIVAVGCERGDALHDASPNASLDSGPKLRLDASSNPAADAGLKLSTDASIAAASDAGFSDGAWQLQVDRHWNRDLPGVFPEMALDEDNYEPVTGATSYDVLVSDGWHSVSIGTAAWLGELSAGASSTLHYELTKGTFAGGRFLVWVTPNGLEAELTIYGSGVPIISSERGRLIRKP